MFMKKAILLMIFYLQALCSSASESSEPQHTVKKAKNEISLQQDTGLKQSDLSFSHSFDYSIKDDSHLSYYIIGGSFHIANFSLEDPDQKNFRILAYLGKILNPTSNAKFFHILRRLNVPFSVDLPGVPVFEDNFLNPYIMYFNQATKLHFGQGCFKIPESASDVSFSERTPIFPLITDLGFFCDKQSYPFVRKLLMCTNSTQNSETNSGNRSIFFDILKQLKSLKITLPKEADSQTVSLLKHDLKQADTFAQPLMIENLELVFDGPIYSIGRTELLNTLFIIKNLKNIYIEGTNAPFVLKTLSDNICQSLKTIYYNRTEVFSIKDFKNLFAHCNSLKTIILPLDFVFWEDLKTIVGIENKVRLKAGQKMLRYKAALPKNQILSPEVYFEKIIDFFVTSKAFLEEMWIEDHLFQKWKAINKDLKECTGIIEDVSIVSVDSQEKIVRFYNRITDLISESQECIDPCPTIDIEALQKYKSPINGIMARYYQTIEN